jgi:protein-disulfide isomerase
LAECADTLRPGSFWEAHDVLFALIIDQGLTQSSVDMYVDRMELNLDDLVACFEGANQIAVDSEFGSDLGVTGTPAVMIRYGAGEPEWIVVDDQTFDRGGVDFEILAAVVENASKSK